MKKIMSALLEQTQTYDMEGNCVAYQVAESDEIEGATGWENIEDFIDLCLNDVEIVKNPNFAIYSLPQDDAVVITPEKGEEGHNTIFWIYWAETVNEFEKK